MIIIPNFKGKKDRETTTRSVPNVGLQSFKLPLQQSLQHKSRFKHFITDGKWREGQMRRTEQKAAADFEPRCSRQSCIGTPEKFQDI